MERIPERFVRVSFEVASEAFKVLGDRDDILDTETQECKELFQVIQQRLTVSGARLYNWAPDGSQLSYWAEHIQRSDFYLHEDTLAELCDDLLQRTKRT